MVIETLTECSGRGRGRQLCVLRTERAEQEGVLGLRASKMKVKVSKRNCGSSVHGGPKGLFK